MIEKYRKLQNGSDIRGVAMAGVEGEFQNLSEREAEAIGKGFVRWLCKKLGKPAEELKLAVGRDPRISGPLLKDSLVKGFTSLGSSAIDFGIASTPAMFMATVFSQFRADGTVMITASHLPYNRNGFKFFTAEGGLNKRDISAILEFAAECEPETDGAESEEMKQGCGHCTEADIITPYSEHLKKLIVEGAAMGPRPLEGMKIVVDAGNGAGGFYASKVLEPLGADVSCSQFLEPDGMFPNHPPNPEDKKAMASISKRVIESGADMGIIFDTDVDRSSAVDSRGREIARNGIVAMAAALIAEDHPGSIVVTDSITSRQLSEFLEKKLGLNHFRFKRGYRNVINKAVELNREGKDCQLAIETSGHAALKENYFLDDGAYLATKIVIKAAKLRKQGLSIDSVISELADPADEKEIRIPISGEDFGAYGDKVLADLEAFVKRGGDTHGGVELSLEEPNYEGVRINFPDGWCLLRKSLHDPILPLNMASDTPGGCERIEKFIKGFLSSYERLNLER